MGDERDRLWRRHVCAECDRCGEPLRFLEGPICDACLDAQERSYPLLIQYAAMAARERDRFRPVEEDPELVGSFSVGEDRVAIDLERGEFVRVPR